MPALHTRAPRLVFAIPRQRQGQGQGPSRGCGLRRGMSRFDALFERSGNDDQPLTSLPRAGARVRLSPALGLRGRSVPRYCARNPSAMPSLAAIVAEAAGQQARVRLQGAEFPTEEWRVRRTVFP